MPLKLVTGPANSGRAGEVLGAYRARIHESPILVVPAFRDVEHVLRELGGGGAVLGAEVVRFARLFGTIAERCGAGRAARRASRLQRELLVEETVRGLELVELAPSAERPGFARAALRLVAELERSMVEPDSFEQALDAWAGGGPRRRYAREVAAIYRAYRERLDAAGLVDAELVAWHAADALRERPERWGDTPVFAYGFDDFTPIELDALETLAGRAGAQVVVSLPYERGRVAFKAVAPVFERLAAIADEHVELPAVADHYAEPSRAALHRLERRLYEAGGPDGRAEAGDAVRLLEAGGERAEVELVAAEALRLVRSGTPAGEVAVVFREPGRHASLVEQVFGAYGVPYSIERWVPLGHTALGRGLLALIRAAGRAGTADDLLAYLRTPGLLELPRIADRLEAEARRQGARSAREAGKLWEERRWRLHELDRLGRAEGLELLDAVESELGRLFAAGYGRRAPLFDGAELEDPRVFEAARAALRELRALQWIALDGARVHEALERVRVRLGEAPAPDRVQVTGPEAVRARRFAAVFVCGLQEGEFPRVAQREPFLPDDDRRAIAAASDLVLPVRDDELDRERHLFYVCASRAERTLLLSSRFADEEGRPQVRSFFVDEAVDLFESGLADGVVRRTLADVAWPPELAPTEAEWERAMALAGPEREQPAPDGLHAREVLDDLGARRAFSAGALETFADCPVKWLVDRLLRPDPLEPDPEPMVRGSYAHAVLEATYLELQRATGSAAVTEATLPRAEEILLEQLREKQSEFRLSPKETRVRTAVRRLEFDLLRHLRREAEAGGDFEPRELELEFGMTDEGRPAVELQPEGVSLRGRIDRVDVWDGHALVRDYKSGKKAYPVARWEEDNRLQVAVYMLAVRELLDLEPAGGVYVPLADRRGQPRGLLRKDLADRLGRGFVDTDLKDADEVERQLARARERVCEIAGRIRAGDVRPCPQSCAWNGGCSHPSICRVEER